MSRLLIPSGDVGMGTVTDEDGEEIDMDLIEVDEGLTPGRDEGEAETEEDIWGFC